MLATLVVDLGGDKLTPVGDGKLTLREAVLYINGEDVEPGDETAFDVSLLGNNDRIEIDVDTVTLEDSLVLEQPATIAPHNGRDVSIVRDPSASFPRNFGIALAPSRSGGAGEFNPDTTMIVEDLTISGFLVGVRIVPNANTAGSSPVSAVLRNNRIDVTTGAFSTIGVEVIDDEIPFQIEGNVITGPGIDRNDPDADIGIAIQRATLGPGSIEQTHASLVKDNEISAIEIGILVRNTLLPNLEISGGSIGDIPSDPQWSGEGVNTGVFVTGDTGAGAPAVQRSVGRISTSIKSDNTSLVVRRVDDLQIVNLEAFSDAADAINISNGSTGIEVRDSVLVSALGNDIDISGFNQPQLSWSANTYVVDGDAKPIKHPAVPNPTAGSGPVSYLGDAWESLVTLTASQSGEHQIDLYARADQPSGEAVYRYVETRTRTIAAGGQLSETMQFIEGASGWNAGESVYSVVTLPDGNSSELAPVTSVLSDGSPATSKVYVVSTTADGFDADYTYGNFSLREAVGLANTDGVASTVLLPGGMFQLSLQGAESGADVAINDIDVSGDVTVFGAGPGVSVIEAIGSAAASPSPENRVFSVAGANSQFRLSGVTLTGVDVTQSSGFYFGGGILAIDGATLLVEDSVFVGNNLAGSGIGTGISSQGADTTVLRSVFTANSGYGGTAIYASEYGSTRGRVV